MRILKDQCWLVPVCCTVYPFSTRKSNNTTNDW
uniref:Uncharacterized protein n=1 Tax=Anguilla anguilla TaxID=7936 RepID=A0A0E9RP16_ANGAN